VCLFVSMFKLCVTYFQIATEGPPVFAQCASDVHRSTAAQYIRIRDGITISSIEGDHYRDFFIALDSIERTYIYREAKIDVWVHVNTHMLR